MELVIVVLIATILGQIGVIISLKAKIESMAKLVSKIQKTNGREDAYIVLVWYAKQAAVLNLRYRQYKDAFKWMFDSYRLNMLPPDYKKLTYQEFMEVLVSKEVFSNNWYEREKIIGELPLKLHDIMKDSDRLKEAEIKRKKQEQ